MPTERFPRRDLALLAIAVALAYANSLYGAFQFDDYNVIVEYPQVHGWAAWWWDAGHGLRPLLKASYTLNWTLNTEPWGFRLFNIGVHALNTLLVYALTLDLARTQNRLAAPHRAALLCALLFALHPAQTEVVTYISGRSTGLMALFYLAALYAYTQARYKTALSLFLAALAAKEVAVTLPAALLLWECGRRQRLDWRAVLRRQLPYWLLLIALGCAALLRTKYAEFFEVSLETRGPFENLLTQANGIFWLLGQYAWPLTQNIDPDLPIITRLSPLVALQGGALLAGLALGLWALRRRLWLGVAILWFYLHLAPTNSIFPRIDVANDRQLYLAGLGLTWLLVFGLNDYLHRLWLRTGFAVLLLALALLTAQRNRDYASEISLWQQTARVSPDKARPHNNLAHAYRLAGCSRQAAASWRRALKLEPDYILPRANLERLEREQRLGLAGRAECEES